MLFEEINDAHEERIRELLAQTEYEGSEFSLLCRRGWSFYNYASMQAADTGDTLFVRFLPGGGFQDCSKYVYLPPLTKLSNIRAAMDALKAYLEERGEHACVMALPQEYAERLQGAGYEILPSNPDYEEYLYDPRGLIELAGKKLHAKRNHVHRFCAVYQGRYAFRSYEPADKPGIMRLYTKWSDGKEDDGTLMNEFRLLSLGLKMAEEGRAYADVMEIDGKIAGFALGETLPSGVAVVHVEKGEIEFDGIYSVINQMFSKKHFEEGVRLVNRQEDMGLAGLRRAKRSYQPVKMAKKHVIKL